MIPDDRNPLPLFDLPTPAGLCAACRHARRLSSSRSCFLRCDLADRDPELARYPRLPVLSCCGFTDRGEVPPAT